MRKQAGPNFRPSSLFSVVEERSLSNPFCGLPLFRGDASKRRRERLVSGNIYRPVFDFCARRILAKKIVILPILRRSNRSENKAAATIWTNVPQDILNAIGAKRTFIGADACLKGVGWQSPVAVLAGRPEFQHSVSLHSWTVASARVSEGRRRHSCC